MKKILVFNPPTDLYRRDNRCQNRVEDQTVNVVFPPMELLYCAAVLERGGHEVHVRDYPAVKADWKTFEEDLASLHPDITLFTCTIATLEDDLAAAETIKRLLPNALTAAKGEPLHYMDEEILQSTPSLDLILRGEAEAYIADLADGKPWDNLPGVSFRRGANIVRTVEGETHLELDALPFPARHLIDNALYRSPETRHPLTTIVASAGCPHQCIFCSVPALTGTNVRFRSPESIVMELEECVQRYGIREFLFHADTFTLRKDWVIALCRRIVEKKLDIRWGCNSRVDTIDEERLRWMKQAGCWVVGFGVESGNDEHLKWMKKRATAAQAREAIRLCRQTGVRSHAFFVFGFPWETEQSIRELIAFAEELDPDFFDFNVAFPIPGTELERLEAQKGLVVRERRRSGGYAVGAVATETLSTEELEKWRRRALWKMYLRPHYILRTLWSAGSPKTAYHYLCAAFNRIRNLLAFSRKRRTESIHQAGAAQ
ncbi:MAG: radical SAM protein [Candidatus Omnitrophota bacterium]